jgi:hypothetical protein
MGRRMKKMVTPESRLRKSQSEVFLRMRKKIQDQMRKQQVKPDDIRYLQKNI